MIFHPMFIKHNLLIVTVQGQSAWHALFLAWNIASAFVRLHPRVVFVAYYIYSLFNFWCMRILWACQVWHVPFKDWASAYELWCLQISIECIGARAVYMHVLFWIFKIGSLNTREPLHSWGAWKFCELASQGMAEQSAINFFNWSLA